MPNECTCAFPCGRTNPDCPSVKTLSFETEDATIDKGEKYIKPIRDRNGNIAYVDVYDVLVAFGINCPATAHAVKKVLCAGERGHKGFHKDMDEAINSLHRAKMLR